MNKIIMGILIGFVIYHFVGLFSFKNQHELDTNYVMKWNTAKNKCVQLERSIDSVKEVLN